MSLAPDGRHTSVRGQDGEDGDCTIRGSGVNHPRTTLDTRFSEPGAVATSWEDARRVLERAELFWITTVRHDGRPHVTPLVAVWHDERLYFCTGPSEQKA